MDFYDLACKEKDILDKDIYDLNKEISGLPQEPVSCAGNRNGFIWRTYVNGERRTVPREKIAGYVPERALRQLLECRAADKSRERDALDAYIAKHREYDSKEKELVGRSAGWREMLEPYLKPMNQKLYEWQFLPFRTNPVHPEHLKYPTMRGELVRSKSECFIADYLFTHRIPYRYECELVLQGETMYPDFTIRHPLTGAVYYHEHFGRMDDREYIYKSTRKLRLYSESGYQINRNLLVTSETGASPLSSKMVQEYLSMFFE